MTDHTENTLRAASKALSDVVATAVDKDDPLAAEQLGLVIEYISFVQDRLDHLYERERFDLLHALKTMGQVQELKLKLPPEEVSRLAEVAASGWRNLSVAGVPPAVLRESAAEVNGRLVDVIRGISAGPDADRRAELSRVVLDASADKLDFERSWYLPFGFDPEPQNVLPLDQALAQRAYRDPGDSLVP